jgi:hypothetical protein
MKIRQSTKLWSKSISLFVLTLAVLMLSGWAGRIFAACNVSCALFAAGSVTNQLNTKNQVQFLQFKNDCYNLFNTTQAANNNEPDGSVANQWRPVTANLDCNPSSQSTGTTINLTFPGQGNTPTNPGAYADVVCGTKCVKPS